MVAGIALHHRITRTTNNFVSLSDREHGNKGNAELHYETLYVKRRTLSYVRKQLVVRDNKVNAELCSIIWQETCNTGGANHCDTGSQGNRRTFIYDRNNFVVLQNKKDLELRSII